MKMKFLPALIVLFLSNFSALSQEIVKLGKRYSLMNTKHEVFSNEFDNIYVDGDHYYFQNGKKLGLIHKSQLESTDWDKFVTEYDLINNLNSGNDTLRFALAKNGKFGVADKFGKLQSGLIYDSVFVTRFWTGNLFFKLNNKLAFHPFKNALNEKNLVFEYDQVLSSTNWVTAYRKGDKYGFFTRWDQHAFTIPPIFDSVPKQGDAFVETWTNGVKTYYYSYDLLLHHGWTKSFDLELGQGIKFMEFDGQNGFEVPGPKRTEKCFVEYHNLVVCNKDKADIMVIDLSDGLSPDLLQNPTAIESLVQLNYEKGYSHGDSLLMIKVRIPIDEKTVREVYYSFRNLDELASIEIGIDEATVLKQCEWNYDFIAVYIENADGKAKKPYGFFEVDFPGTFKRTKPMVDGYHKSGGSSGGGKWMDILWMGGR